MAAPDRPRSPAAPRFEARGEGDRVADLGPSAFRDDALVSGHHVTALALDQHSSEFVEWAQCRVVGGSVAGSEWYKPVWRDLELVGVDASNSLLTEASLARVAIRQSKLTGAVWSGSGLTDLLVEDSVVDLTTLRSCTLTRVVFRHCRMSQADLSMSRLTDVWFDDCDLGGAQFHHLGVGQRCWLTGSELLGAKGLVDLRGAGVEPVNLLDFTGQLAAELGIHVLEQQAGEAPGR